MSQTSQTTYRYLLKSARMLAANTRHLVFECEDKTSFSYAPGQFISIHIPTTGKAIRRNFSIANPPTGNGEIELACAYVLNGLATTLLSNIKEGEAIDISGPYGLLLLKEEDPQRYIFVATGTGITPYRSMLPNLARRLEAKADLEIVVLFGARTLESLLYVDEFLDFAKQHPRFRYMAALSQDSPSDLSFASKGYVQHQFESLNLKPGSDFIYLCGNPNMIDQSFTALIEAGFDRKAIKREKYISGPLTAA